LGDHREIGPVHKNERADDGVSHSGEGGRRKDRSLHGALLVVMSNGFFLRQDGKRQSTAFLILKNPVNPVYHPACVVDALAVEAEIV
jgi:hypothetical protein